MDYNGNVHVQSAWEDLAVQLNQYQAVVLLSTLGVMQM